MLSYIALRESSQLFFFKQKILVPSSVLTAVVRQSLPAKQWLTETRRVSTVKCENSCLVGYSDDCCKTIAACETVVDRNSTGFYC